jgi:ribonuclease T1
MPADQRRTIRLALALLAVVVVLGVWWWVGQGSDSQLGAGGASSTTSSRSAASQSPGPAPRDASGLPSVEVAELPAEAQETLELISAGGPYPYPRDGATFQNRERLLPRKAGGYYHEYTVPTPGESDRGARRIITGRDGELYWTPDHYASFRVIVSSVIEGGGP